MVIPPADLHLISAVGVHCGCMSLPQELLDHIMEMLCDDLRALKACSLTCKAMFTSTQRLIYQTLHLTARNNEKVLIEERIKDPHQRSDYHGLRYLSFMGERGLLRYTRHIRIRDRGIFTPDTLLHHLHHFQSLDRVHTLSIAYYDAAIWENHRKTCFSSLYPTLTSLTLSHTFSGYRSLFQFALQFPNLENLSLQWLVNDLRITPDLTSFVIVDKSPPLRGRLRLVGVDSLIAVEWPIDLTHELSNVVNFRSVEIEDFSGNQSQYILRACAHTLENLTIVPHELSTLRLSASCFPQNDWLTSPR